MGKLKSESSSPSCYKTDLQIVDTRIDLWRSAVTYFVLHRETRKRPFLGRDHFCQASKAGQSCPVGRLAGESKATKANRS